MSKSDESSNQFYDWLEVTQPGNGYFSQLEAAYKANEFLLIIGPTGSGKTHLVTAFAEKLGKPLFTVNFSLRTRESHLVGSIDIEEGDTSFKEGVLVRSMREPGGSILYADEINCAEPDVLVRIDEALDDRRQISLKEDSGEVIKAEPGWFVIATINPIQFAGTKEMPAQINSRFPARMWMDYPDEIVEAQIVERRTGVKHASIEKACLIAKQLRGRAANGELFYSPSIRETIAFANILNTGMSPRDSARMVFKNIYYQWGASEARKAEEIITSLLER